MSKHLSKTRSFLRVLGPGLISGASNDDPASIGTFTRAGASHGNRLLWAPVYMLPFMMSVQFICAKVSIVTGKGLSGVLRSHYPGWLLYLIVGSLSLANTLEAGADLGAMAAAINLVSPVRLNHMLLVFVIAAVVLLIQVLGKYKQVRKVYKWLTLALIAYIGAGFLARPAIHEVLKASFVPRFELGREFISLVVAALGASISPYLFFWVTAGEAEEKKAGQQRAAQGSRQLTTAGLDTSIGIIFANIVVYFVILTSAAALYKKGGAEVTTAVEAARALKPLAGEGAELLWSLGLFGAGLLGVPALTGSAAYAVSEALGLPGGFDETVRSARGFYAVIIGATAIAVLLNLIGFNPIYALYLVEIINGLVAPPLLFVIMLISNNKIIMGGDTNGPVSNFFGWGLTLVMFAAAAGLGAVYLFGK